MQGLSLNFGIWIRDAGWSRFSGTHRIMITLRFRVRYEREIRRVKCESVKRFEGRDVPTIKPVF
jgi:hypothetical protein